MVKLQLIGVGTGRCGTRYVAKLLSSAGLLCGHEYFFSYPGLVEARRRLGQERNAYVGDASWLAVPLLESPELRDALVVHIVRHPKAVIESMLRVPPGLAPPYDAYLRRHLPIMWAYDEEIDRDALRYVGWNRWIERLCADGRPYVRYRVEDGPMALFELMQEVGAVNKLPNEGDLFSNTKCNTKGAEREHVEADPDAINFMLRVQLREVTQEYGYDWPGLTG
uniref:Putative sulfotransferase domain contining protein n=1 Tax=viral metagenome TaxID=1070528 RepID=A0A6M3M7S3_9ZZZZ